MKLLMECGASSMRSWRVSQIQIQRFDGSIKYKIKFKFR